MRRSFARPTGQQAYRKLFLIAAEGSKTEPQYFSLFNNRHATIQIKCLKGGHGSSPPQVLKRMKTWLQENSLKDSDEAWLVVDKDQWTDQQIMQLYTWSQSKMNYGFALSNPKFEYWLLLHFEDGKGVYSSEQCSERLRRHLPDYDKEIDLRKISPDKIGEAVGRAKERDKATDWPRAVGTTVYILVEKLIQPECF